VLLGTVKMSLESTMIRNMRVKRNKFLTRAQVLLVLSFCDQHGMSYSVQSYIVSLKPYLLT